MQMHNDNLNFQREALPAEYDEQMVQVDAMLTKAVSAQDVPAGLTQRVYEASVSHLPSQRVLQFSANQPANSRPMFSRLSMAAAVALAVVVGIVFLRSPGLNGFNGALEVAYNGSTVTPVSLHVDRHSASLSAAQEWVIFESVQLGHFADARHLSISDVVDDLAMLVRELEM